jgi:predicted phosphodiesterase
MRVAALYDIHGNAPALEAALADVPEDAAIVIGGDVAIGFEPVRTLELLDELGERAHWIRGNGERIGSEAGVWAQRQAWTIEQIGESRAYELAALPETLTLEIDGLGPTLFCHGSPRSDEESITRVTSETRLAEILTATDEKTIVCGHTHQQFNRRVSGKQVVNAGSVGIPYEGRPAAFWVLLGPEVEHRSSDYDVAAAASAFRATGFPDPDEIVGWLVDDPPKPDEVSELFEQQALEAEGS